MRAFVKKCERRTRICRSLSCSESETHTESFSLSSPRIHIGVPPSPIMELDTSLSPPSSGKERDARLSPYVQAAYRVITAAATPLLGLLLLVRQALGKESATRLRERWGHATTRRPRGRLVWLHAASLGEGAAALPLITKILEESPSTSILVTGGSVAADDWRRRAFPAEVIRQFVPVDTPSAVERFVTHWKPDVGIFVDSELWPNLIARSSANGVRLALVNARMSASSAKMWSLPVANCLFRDTLRNFHVISTQVRGGEKPKDQKTQTRLMHAWAAHGRRRLPVYFFSLPPSLFLTRGQDGFGERGQG